MADKPSINVDKIDPQRMATLRRLPIEIKQLITGEEARAFLHNEPLPDSLVEKLKDYLAPEDDIEGRAS